MPKFRLIIAIALLLFFSFSSYYAFAQSAHTLKIEFVDVESNQNSKSLNLQNSFISSEECNSYVTQLPELLRLKGFLSASIDSVFSSVNQTSIKLFLGKQYSWAAIVTKDIPQNVLSKIGWQLNTLENKKVSFAALEDLQRKCLAEFQNTGYPFASVALDSIAIENNQVTGRLLANKGVFYRVDSVNIIGNGKISKQFLNKYLNIENGSAFNKQKLEQVDDLLLQLPFIQSERKSDLSMLARSAVLNLYLAPKKNSTISAIVGFLPNPVNPGKLQVTGDVNLNLKNTFGKGESIIAIWQQLQLNSPRLNLGYQQPYILATKFGVDANFELFKKDDAFLQTQIQLGVQYQSNANQQYKLFFQNTSRFLLADGVDTQQIKITKRLPINIDVSATSIGVEYAFNNTDYRLNPLKGYDVKMNIGIGIKTIKPNATITSLVDPSFNFKSLYDSFSLKSAQIRILASAEKYTSIGKQSTIKTSINSGLFISPNVFRNELFQIGGYKLLRGFNEESIYATNYLVGNVEYRYRLSLNSFFFGFANSGWVQNKFQNIDIKEWYHGTGLGIVFENKFGLLNFSYALGISSNTTFRFGDASKIHFGYVNYF